MLALSVQQPWPWLIFHGGKDVENRDWAPPRALIGQRIAIHASKKRQPLEPVDIMSDIAGFGVENWWEPKIPELRDLPVGVLLGTVVLDGVTRDGKIHANGKGSKWFVGTFGWILVNPKTLAEPIPARGQLGLWPVPESALPALEAL